MWWAIEAHCDKSFWCGVNINSCLSSYNTWWKSLFAECNGFCEPCRWSCPFGFLKFSRPLQATERNLLNHNQQQVQHQICEACEVVCFLRQTPGTQNWKFWPRQCALASAYLHHQHRLGAAWSDAWSWFKAYQIRTCRETRGNSICQVNLTNISQGFRAGAGAHQSLGKLASCFH